MNKTYTQTFLLIWALLGLLYVLVGSHAFMHSIQDDRWLWADPIFQLWTRLGEGWLMPLILAALWMLHRSTGKQAAAMKAMGYTIVLAIVIPQGMKWLFSDSPRPWTVFPTVQELPGLVKSYYKSFPSGHTAFGVAWTAAWSCLAPKKYQVPVVMTVLALGVGFSRIHLHMHWLHDVIAGGILGLGCAYLGLRWSGFTETH
ncbi:MAG: hypothetical protein RL168_1009 [Bacteroidota bacterium]